MSPKLFQRRRENFTCQVCGATVTGTGYTNHCPQCLWSKHVDVHPGDRAEACQGLMKPTGLEIKNGRKIILHRCEACGFTRKNEAAPDDNPERLIEISVRRD